MSNPPPPYDEITGLYVQIDKHVDANLASYNGNARPGQLVVDTSDYTLYVGNANGNLNVISGGGSGNTGDWVFNGNEVTVNNSGYPRLYGGPFGGPELSYVEQASNPSSYSQTMYINDQGLTVSLDYGNVELDFTPDGNLTVPGNIITNGSSGNITGANVIEGQTFVSSATSYASLTNTTAGARAFITDANLTASGNFGTVVSGGGSNASPVYYDGTNWLIG